MYKYPGARFRFLQDKLEARNQQYRELEKRYNDFSAENRKFMKRFNEMETITDQVNELRVKVLDSHIPIATANIKMKKLI